ncbi:putative lipoprotein [Burkholderia multivorans CGD1]|nr:putative lipoprotein [Burkholderia multivorans CGD1]
MTLDMLRRLVKNRAIHSTGWLSSLSCMLGATKNDPRLPAGVFLL